MKSFLYLIMMMATSACSARIPLQVPTAFTASNAVTPAGVAALPTVPTPVLPTLTTSVPAPSRSLPVGSPANSPRSAPPPRGSTSVSPMTSNPPASTPLTPNNTPVATPSNTPAPSRPSSPAPPGNPTSSGPAQAPFPSCSNNATAGAPVYPPGSAPPPPSQPGPIVVQSDNTVLSSAYSQCGGEGSRCAEFNRCVDDQWAICPPGWGCEKQNRYYYQCIVGCEG